MGRDAQRTEGVQDNCNVDDLLQERTLHRSEIAESRRDHAHDRQPDPGDNAFNSDAPRAARDLDPRPEPVDTVDQQHDVCRLRRCSGPACVID